MLYCLRLGRKSKLPRPCRRLLRYPWIKSFLFPLFTPQHFCWARASYGVVDIHDIYYPARERYLFSLEPPGVALALPPLVVRERYLPGCIEYLRIRVLENFGPYGGVRPHYLELGIGERARLQEYRVRDAYLANVVHGTCEEYGLHSLLGQAQVPREELREVAYPLYMAPGLLVPLLGRERKPVNGLRIE